MQMSAAISSDCRTISFASSAECVFSGECFLVQGGNVTMIESWSRGQSVSVIDLRSGKEAARIPTSG